MLTTFWIKPLDFSSKNYVPFSLLDFTVSSSFLFTALLKVAVSGFSFRKCLWLAPKCPKKNASISSDLASSPEASTSEELLGGEKGCKPQAVNKI